MRLPVIQGTIGRRILANFRVDPEVMQREIPPRFRPKLHKGQAIAGICLIRLEHVRPRAMPEIVGLSSENAAHRVAVTWVENNQEREGVFISRRDTDSRMNHLLGGRIFPGEHCRYLLMMGTNWRLTMKQSRRSTGVLLVLLLISFVPGTLAQTSDNEYQTGAVLWMQSSGERAALSYQAFSLARMILDRDLRTNQSRMRRAIIVD